MASRPGAGKCLQGESGFVHRRGQRFQRIPQMPFRRHAGIPAVARFHLHSFWHGAHGRVRKMKKFVSEFRNPQKSGDLLLLLVILHAKSRGVWVRRRTSRPTHLGFYYKMRRSLLFPAFRWPFERNLSIWRHWLQGQEQFLPPEDFFSGHVRCDMRPPCLFERWGKRAARGTGRQACWGGGAIRSLGGKLEFSNDWKIFPAVFQ
ncbi:MAG: hypothetical protein IKQ55_02680 [Kiritimatiellae bacterium]|nr:hypothetical protein [Kiritimatiellia bacterium]